MPEAARPTRGVRDVARQAEDAAVHRREGARIHSGWMGGRGAVAWAEIDLLRLRRSSGYRRPGRVRGNEGIGQGLQLKVLETITSLVPPEIAGLTYITAYPVLSPNT